MKIQTKITLHFLSLSIGILLVLNAFILYFEYQFNYQDFYKRLFARVNLAADIKILPHEQTRSYREVRNRYLELLDAEKEQIIKADASGKFAKHGLPVDFFNDLSLNKRAQYKQGNKFYAGKVVRKDHERFMVVVSAQNPYGLRELDELKTVLFYGFLGSLVIVFFVGKIFSFYTFAPIRRLTAKMNTISSSNLHERLEITGRDEVAELSQTFNNMLTRLETAFETQNNFVSNASHELRTPLTIIKSEIELALNKTDPESEAHRMLNTVHTETEKLIQILNSLLALAQSGFDGKKQNWQVIRIDELILDAVSAVKRIRPKADIDVDFSNLPADESQLNIAGNNNLLNLALTNIISNGAKYSQDKLVVVKLAVEKGRAAISVTDQGIGIPKSDLQHVFEPFFRASNTHEYKGHGVGLPLTLNIVRLHKGTIGIRSEVNIGTEITISIPLYNSLLIKF